MAITSGNGYVDTDLGTDDASHGTGSGANACRTLKYFLNSILGTMTGNVTVYCVGATADGDVGSWSNHSSSSYKLTIKGNRWSSTTDGKWSDSYYHIVMTVDSYMFTCYEANLELDGLQLKQSSNNSNNHLMRYYGDGNATDALVVKNCIATATTGSGAYAFVALASHASATMTIINSIIYHMTGGAVLVTSGVANIYNSTIHGCTLGISGGALVKNCLFSANTSDFNATWTTGSDYNSSSADVTWNPVGSYNHDPCSDFNFEDIANHDFRLTATSGDPNARNSGVTLAAASPDPIGTTRPSETSYSRGAFEYVAPVSDVITWTPHVGKVMVFA